MDHPNEMDFVRNILKKVNSPLTSEEILSFALQGVKDSYDLLACSIILLDPARGHHKVVLSKGWSNAFVKEFHQRPFEGFLKVASVLDKPLLVLSADGKNRDDSRVFEHPFESFLAVPMGVGGNTVGILYLSSSSADAFPEETQNFLADLAILFTLIMDHGRLDDRVTTLSRVDPLTHMCSFKYWHEQLDGEIRRAEKVDYDLSLMEIRLNRFKEYNSMHGHVKGDSLLEDVSGIILNRLCNLDVPCRIGSKWHVLLVGEDEDASKSIAEGIIEDMNAHVEKGGLPVSLSIGISTYMRGEGEKTLIQRTENSLREARRLGGSAFRFE